MFSRYGKTEDIHCLVEEKRGLPKRQVERENAASCVLPIWEARLSWCERTRLESALYNQLRSGIY